MSAGSGVRHAEFNVEDEPTTVFQIWIEPREFGGAPGWGAKPFPKSDRSGAFQVLASGFGDEGALPIRANARVLGASVKAGGILTHEVGEGRHAYLVPATGMVEIDGTQVNMRDGVALGEGRFTVRAVEDSEIVLVDAS